MKKLYASIPTTKRIGEQVKAILVFPNIVQAGFLVGGQYGSDAPVQGGTIVGHYNSVAASYGLQAGVQKFGYALFLMNDKALTYLVRVTAGRSASARVSSSWTRVRRKR